MQRFSDVIQNQNGRPKAGLRIVVDPYVANAAPNLTATSTATIYATDGGAAVPFVLTDAAGRFSFYAADGRYNLTVTGAGIVPYMLADVTLNDFIDESTSFGIVSVKEARFAGGAKGDGATNDVPAFAAAAAYAATIGADVEVPPPNSKYLLSSDPTIPLNVDILASPHWFSGPGKLPIHKFMELSEGVDPRIYHIKDGHLSEPPVGNGERFWTGQHVVDIKHDQAFTGPDSVKQDCVGHGTRAYVRGKNGRGWGGVDLVQIFASAVGPGATDTSGYGREIDLNYNGPDIVDFEIIGGPRAKGLLIISAGSNRPEEALYFGSTSFLNRWLAIIRIKADSAEFGIVADEGFVGPTITVPKSSRIMGAVNNAEKVAIRVSADEKSWLFTGNSGADALYVGEASTQVRGALSVRATTQSALISAAKTNLVVIDATTSINTITDGTDGQELTILVQLGSNCTLNIGGNLKMEGGAPIGLTGAASIVFVYTGGYWWQKSQPVGGLS